MTRRLSTDDAIKLAYNTSPMRFLLMREQGTPRWNVPVPFELDPGVAAAAATNAHAGADPDERAEFKRGELARRRSPGGHPRDDRQLGVVEPGAVFEIPARLANPPQAAHRFDPAYRDSGWVLVVDTEAHCLDPRHLTVFTVLLSSQVDKAGPEDVTVLALDGLPVDSIAQTDLVFTLAKAHAPAGACAAGRHGRPSQASYMPNGSGRHDPDLLHSLREVGIRPAPRARPPRQHDGGPDADH